MELKKELFRYLEKLCSEQSLLVTNTCTLSPTEIRAGRPRHVCRHALLQPSDAHASGRAGSRSGQHRPHRGTAAYPLTATGKHVVVVKGVPGRDREPPSAARPQRCRPHGFRGDRQRRGRRRRLRLGGGWPLGPLELTDLWAWTSTREELRQPGMGALVEPRTPRTRWRAISPARVTSAATRGAASTSTTRTRARGSRYRELRLARIYDGTDEIQRKTIARNLLEGNVVIGELD